ncbi:2-keto-3-deoxy-phosphogluconate aldolase [Paraglaciecola sp. T6c]|uniref:bifunctional 4-hydroxy-2-oxoglutarate aldolase/2-dehydro-3-deoxy-phosphogluconate aldolase n=1 Tax=Pseudoalteromonas atlantica (strain T6c / ATCC BAA-1087) TaxID=3042615 RepID=UPI00005C6A2A|nr:bifunctional 4-hydroxy-2-oxoglutarate aldolase/2-dehydro-3-deoxy-phosphogluconate aldolase [Paraglaciecola sp. T6c]ABG41156.1 2-keto-3-deoxy-phosphogluconate aldolase [Paraglaciecola sp. T6c]
MSSPHESQLNSIIRDDIRQRLITEKLVVIIRVKDPMDIPPIIACMHDAGVGAVEITSNTPGYQNAITQARARYPNMLVGAGTITDVALVDEAIKAGAQFLVTPNTSIEVVQRAHKLNVPVVMGALTPTDVVNATQAKADIVKLFPAGAMGPGYLKDLAKGPFLDTIFFPVGGINEHNFETWMQSGATGIGIGGALASPVKNEKEAHALTAKVRAIVATLENYPLEAAQ